MFGIDTRVYPFTNRVVRPEQHVDRGPLDDVVEQIRGQPELEEGESGSSAYMYKPGKNFAGILSRLKQSNINILTNNRANKYLYFVQFM